MSALPSFKSAPVRITDTQNHTVRRYDGDSHDLLDKMIAEKRTGMLLIHLSQGTVFKQLFDTRLKIDKTDVDTS